MFVSSFNHFIKSSILTFGLRLAAVCLLAFGVCATTTRARWQEMPAAPSKESASGKTVDASETAKQANVFPVNPDPVVILRNARTIYVRKKSVYFKASELENALRKKAEFQQLGLLITRDEENADLIVEVGRKVFTSKFVYTVLDSRSGLVLTSGKVSSIGGTLADKISDRLLQKLEAVRPLDPSIKVVP